MNLNFCELGTMDYAETLAIQELLLAARQQQKIGDTLLLVEHPAVLTLGRGGGRSSILLSDQLLQDLGIQVHDANRGGDVTYHGPGQLVGYPILDLKNHGQDIRHYVWKVQEVIIRLLGQTYGIQADRGSHVGVWVGEDKIAAIGHAVRRWVTMHGFALNVNTDLEHFGWIIPCGITDKGVTSLQKLTGSQLSMDEVGALTIEYFCEVFGMHPVHRAVQELTRVCTF
jgi:lipoyl(octanoyl) transferase